MARNEMCDIEKFIRGSYTDNPAPTRFVQLKDGLACKPFLLIVVLILLAVTM